MKHWKQRGFALLLALALTLSLAVCAFAAEPEDTIQDTAAFLLRTMPKAQMGSIGGDWTVLALARAGYAAPERYYQDYYAAVASAVRASDGVLDQKKNTEYSRVILALSAMGKDARNVAGYDLTMPLGDYEQTVFQGLNGAIWALLALDSRDYPMPENASAKTRATRQMYIDLIVSSALPEGGWNFMCDPESEAEPDMTGMALQALAAYQDQAAVKAAVEQALTRMSVLQNDAGGFTSWGSPNLEGSAQMLAALCALGLPADDPRFVKNGRTLLNDLMTFYTPGKGFAHSEDTTGRDLMASEQALLGLIAVERAQADKLGLYSMADALQFSGEKHPDVQTPAIQDAHVTFSDVTDDGAAIQALAARKIVSGMGDGRFHPDETMTRAQFATIVTLALGLTPKTGDAFADVPADRWYAPYVGTAAAYGIIHGRGDGVFDPEGTITRQEAGIMLEQAAALCGTCETSAALRGGEAITRGEMARAVYDLLETSGLL